MIFCKCDILIKYNGDGDNVLSQGENLYGSAVRAGKRDIRMVIEIIQVYTGFFFHKI